MLNGTEPPIPLKYPKHRTKNRKKYSQTQQQYQTPYSHAIYEKFLSILNKKRENYFKNLIDQYFGKNFPIRYKEQYGFQEQWENKESSQLEDSQSYIDETCRLQIIIAITTIVAYFLAVWFTTVQLFFVAGGKIAFYYEIYMLVLSITFINICLEFYKYQKNKRSQFKIYKFLQSQLLTVNVLAYISIKLTGFNNCTHPLWMAFQLFILMVFYHEARKRYQSFRLMRFALQYEYHTKLFDLIATIFIIAHFISIILFSATKLDAQNNWIVHLNIDQTDYPVLYIQSFYFTITTILTVGYGDLTPKNPYQVLIVVIVQIFGITMFGYIINEIGYCISSLRKTREIIQKDLSILQKLNKHYRMPSKLSHKVKLYLLNNKPSADQLSPEDERSILIKLNQQIRMDLIKQNMHSIVKSSMFFLCRWSNHFQQSISKKLTHVLFSPNDILYQPLGKERIYIVKSGKVTVHITRNINQKQIKNVLKTINSSVDKDVSDNCYGYTAAISKRPVNFYAISKNFTSAYYIDKQQFIESVRQKISDIQYYHQLKSKIDQSLFCESIEIPHLDNSKHHYNPTKYYIIRKSCRSNTAKNARRDCMRRQSYYRRTKSIYDEDLINHIRFWFNNRVSFQNFASQRGETPQKVKMKFSLTNKISSIQSQSLCKILTDRDLTSQFDHFFESSQEYNNFFCRSNKSQVLKRLENEQCVGFQKTAKKEQ